MIERSLAALTAAAALALASCCTPLPDAPSADTLIVPTATQPTDMLPANIDLAPATRPADDPLAVTLDDAIVLAMQSNRSLSVQRLAPEIVRTFEQQERAGFDPILVAEASHARDRSPTAAGNRQMASQTELIAGFVQRLPSGTDLSADISSELLKSDAREDQYVTRLGLTVNQALLRGAGLDVNLADVRQARLDTLASEYELRGFAQALVADTENTYWNYSLAASAIDIVTNSLRLAEQQLEEVKQRIEVGRLAQTELSAAEAEVALRHENLINARSALATVRLRLLRLLNPSAGDFWERPVVLLSDPSRPARELDTVESHLDVAQRLRPDLNQARLALRRGDLELAKTRNGLLPRLDLFVSLGKSGYAESFGRSFGNLTEDDYDIRFGGLLEYPLGNRFAEAQHDRAIFSREQADLALENLLQLVQVDVRTAYIEAERSGEQVSATTATRRFQEEKLRAETEKFRVGRSTSYQVAQAQRDLLESQIAEVRAVANHLQSLVNLHLQDGTLLVRRGIRAPGDLPPEK